MTGDPWREYLAAAQRLDVVRRGAATASAEQDRTLRSARDELTGVRARLAPQRARLRELGVPDDQLVPGLAEVAAAGQLAGRQPASVLRALRQARVTADAADAAVIGGAAWGGSNTPWLRNLLVYGPFSAAVLFVQIALYLVADSASSPMMVGLCGLAMSVLAFGLGWLVVGLVFPPEPDGRVRRSPLVGAVVCLVPLVMSCLGATVPSILG